MPLFAPADALSVEAPVLYALAELVASSEGFRAMNLGRTAEECAEKVHVCESVDPWDADSVDRPDPEVSIRQLEDLLLMAWVQPQNADGFFAEADPTTSPGCPNEGGIFEVSICRQILLSEWNEHGRDQLYLWFLDCTSRIAHDIAETAWLAGHVITSVRRNGRPTWNANAQHSAQGRNLYVSFEVDWGDRGDGD